MSAVVMYCPDCAADRTFDQPVCADGHGVDCPDLCCVECGLAVFAGAFDSRYGIWVGGETAATRSA